MSSSPKTKLQALIFDVDGTLADTEMAHLAAFNHAFKEDGLDWHWDVPTYTRLLQISGGKERMLHYWKEVQGAQIDIGGAGLHDTIERLHSIKTAAYEHSVQAGAVALRPGVLKIIQTAVEAGLRLAIATTTSPVNVIALLKCAIGADWRQYFTVVEDASTAANKKPHPQVYQQTLQRLGLPAAACLAFEDSENGLKAALGAGIATVVTPNSFTQGQDFAQALRVVPSLAGIGLAHLQQWHAQALDPSANKAATGAIPYNSKFSQ